MMTTALRSEALSGPATLRRLRLDIRGAVQGVGFRPHVYRLAVEMQLAGWILNDADGVRIEVQAELALLERFAARLLAELPPRAAVHEVRRRWVSPVRDANSFEIRVSDAAGMRSAVVLPDVATCDDCRRELFDQTNRRHAYPFINCTNCGPRYSIIRTLPYDRPNTTMAGFTMCARCRAEYDDPFDRRFHAQPIACPDCGPRLTLLDARGERVATFDPVAAVAAALARGEIVAVKGIGGFHLMADACNEPAVRRLRERKHRPAKPLALMVADVSMAREFARVSASEAELLGSAEAPIVLLDRLVHTAIAPSVAPGTRSLGIMLPYTPLHHLLLAATERPLVATSGNLSEEPICTDNDDAVERLGGVADWFLVHDRPIERHVDDSVTWVVRESPAVLRRARGFAPLPLRLATEVPPLLALGAHQKSAVAIGIGGQAVVSQHLGDLDTPQAITAMRTAATDLLRLWSVTPGAVVHDLHPAYASTAWASDPELLPGVPRIGVQHHHAHLASCLADNGAIGPALGIVWDGSGFGAVDGLGDGTVWGASAWPAMRAR